MNLLNHFLNEANRIIDMEQAYQLRSRYGTNRSQELTLQEKAAKNRMQTKAWLKLKQQFIENRETLFEQAKGFPEALNLLNQIDRVLGNEIDQILLESK